MKEERQKTHWPQSALIQEGCQEGRGIHRRINLGQSRSHFLRILTAPDAGHRGVLSLAPFHRGGASVGVPAEAPANTRPAAGGPRRPRGFAPAIPLPAGGIFQLYQRIYRLYQLDRSQVGPESRSPPRAGASGRRAGARASPASAHASAPAATAGLDLGYPSWAPRVSAPVLRCLVSL